MKFNITLYQSLRTMIFAGLLAGSNVMAGVSVERQTTFTDDSGGSALTIGRGQFDQPGSEFSVTANFSNFQPRTDGHTINGELSAESNIDEGNGFLSRGAARTTIFNGDLNISNLPNGDEDVQLQIVDLQVNDRSAARRGPPPGRGGRQGRQNRRGGGQGGNSWTGTVIVNGETFAPDELPRKVKETIRRLMGFLRH